MYVVVHSSITHNSPKVEITHTSISNEWIHKMWYRHTMECYSAVKGVKL